MVVKLRVSRFRVIKDIDYLTPPATEKADLYLPKSLSDQARPAIVVIHGGGWVEGEKDNPREVSICSDLADHGFVVLSIDYTLYREGDPATLWPTNLHQCKTAVRWLRKHAGEYGIDANHIGVLGESAGGQLAAMVALTHPEHGLDPEQPDETDSCRVQAAVVLYAPTDFRQRQTTLAMLGGSPTDAPGLYAQASPAAYGRPGDPPVMIIHGTADTMVAPDQATSFAAALAAAGVPHELVLVPEAGHAFDLRPLEQDLRPVVLGFFDKHLLST